MEDDGRRGETGVMVEVGILGAVMGNEGGSALCGLTGEGMGERGGGGASGWLASTSFSGDEIATLEGGGEGIACGIVGASETSGTTVTSGGSVTSMTSGASGTSGAFGASVTSASGSRSRLTSRLSTGDARSESPARAVVGD